MGWETVFIFIVDRLLLTDRSNQEVEVYQNKLMTVNELEQQFGALWTQCQRCQGSMHYDVICINRDCPIFYRRSKVKKDLAEASAALARFVDW